MHLIQRKRIIPVLLVHKGGLVKTKKFSKPVYVGDPINAVRIFNDKEVDELVILDIDASKNNTPPNFELIEEIVSEAFMPVAYGGGITTLKQAHTLFTNGVEKVILNSVLHTNLELVKEITNQYGSQSVMVSLDIKTNMLGKKKIYLHSSGKSISTGVVEFAQRCQNKGAGEVLLNSVDRDGMYLGYDLESLKQVSQQISIPVVVCGGASSKHDFEKAEVNGASAMAAGSMFVFQRPNQAVLISYDI